MSRYVNKFIEKFTEQFELPLQLEIKQYKQGKSYKLYHKNAKYGIILQKVPKGIFIWQYCRSLRKRDLILEISINELDQSIDKIIEHYHRNLRDRVWRNLEKAGQKLNNTPDPS